MSGQQEMVGLPDGEEDYFSHWIMDTISGFAEPRKINDRGYSDGIKIINPWVKYMANPTQDEAKSKCGLHPRPHDSLRLSGKEKGFVA